MDLTRESRERSWWQGYGVSYGTLIDLEQSANSISQFSSCLVPGRLQTEEYARAVIKEIYPEISAKALEQQVEARMRRQSILTQEDSPSFWAIIDELALVRPIGGAGAMVSQIEYLIERSEIPSVSLQIIPITSGAHPGLGQAFSLLEFDSANIKDVVFVETWAGDAYLERSDDVAKHRERFNILRSFGQSFPDSRNLLWQSMERLKSS